MRVKAMRYLNHPQKGQAGIIYRCLAKRLALLLLFPVMANLQMMGAGYDRPYGDPKLSRSVVMAPSAARRVVGRTAVAVVISSRPVRILSFDC